MSVAERAWEVKRGSSTHGIDVVERKHNIIKIYGRTCVLANGLCEWDQADCITFLDACKLNNLV
jgi:hypothetical protein